MGGYTFRYFNGQISEAAGQEIMGAVTKIEDFDRVMRNNQVELAARAQAMQRVSVLIGLKNTRIQGEYNQASLELARQKEARLAREGEVSIALNIAAEQRLTANTMSEIRDRIHSQTLADSVEKRQRLNTLIRVGEVTQARTDTLRKEFNFLQEAGAVIGVVDQRPPEGTVPYVDGQRQIWFVTPEWKRGLDIVRLEEEAKIQAGINKGTTLTEREKFDHETRSREFKFDNASLISLNKEQTSLTAQFNQLGAQAEAALRAFDKPRADAFVDDQKEVGDDIKALAAQINQARRVVRLGRDEIIAQDLTEFFRQIDDPNAADIDFLPPGAPARRTTNEEYKRIIQP